MGECLIARGQTATKNVLDDIPVSGDYCSIVVLLQDSAGGPCENTKINCKDGTRWYNYTTNEAGMVLFKCNSGAANITVNNWINGIYTFDQAAFNKNYDAPVGTKRLEKLSYERLYRFNETGGSWASRSGKSYNGQFRVSNRVSNIVVVGGGGSGSHGHGGGVNFSVDIAGGGGGGGAKSYLKNYEISKNQTYKVYIGCGGLITEYDDRVGKSGESTMAFGISANGGCAGVDGEFNTNPAMGGIGMYNGGNGASGGKFYYKDYTPYHATNGINGAGGGGGGYPRSSTSSITDYEIMKGGINGGGGYKNNPTYTWIQDMYLCVEGSGGGGAGGKAGSKTGEPTKYIGMSGASGRLEFDME